MNTLNVFLYDHFVGTLRQDNQKKLLFKYDPEYLKFNNASAISLSMPLVQEAYPDEVSRPFFTGLLPEGILIKKLANQLNTETDNIFNLLMATGGDCPGAISMYPQDIEPVTDQFQEGHILDDEELYDLILMLNDRPLLVKEPFMRLSISGSQSKLPVSLIDDKITLMKGNYPTTHILKLPLSNEIDTLQNEMFCIKLAQLAGFNVPKHNIRWCKDLPYMLIERYDRIVKKDGSVEKLHQEDFCQALAVLPINKEETSGGPGINDCLTLIDTYAKQPAVDKITFLKLTIFNYLIGNSDYNGKSLSFLYNQNKLSLAPVHNLLSNAIYSKLSPKMAMTIDGKYYPNLIRMDNWHKIVADNSTARKMIEKELKKMAVQIPKLAEKTLVALNEEGNISEVYDQIVSMIYKRSKHIIRYTHSSSDNIDGKSVNPNYTFEKISPPVVKQTQLPYMTTDKKSPPMQTSRESLNPAVSLNTQNPDIARKNDNISPKLTFDKLPQPSSSKSKPTSNIEDLSIQIPREPLSPPVSNSPLDAGKKESVSPKSTFDKLPQPSSSKSKPTSNIEDLSIQIPREPLSPPVSNSQEDAGKKESISPKSTFDKLFQSNISSEKEDLSIKNTYRSLPPAINSESMNEEKREIINPKSTFKKLPQPPSRSTYKPDSSLEKDNSPPPQKQNDKKYINPKSTFGKIIKEDFDNKKDR